jgi:hypothetical protein
MKTTHPHPLPRSSKRNLLSPQAPPLCVAGHLYFSYKSMKSHYRNNANSRVLFAVEQGNSSAEAKNEQELSLPSIKRLHGV